MNNTEKYLVQMLSSMTTNGERVITIEESRLLELLSLATRQGAQQAFRRFVRYNYKQAANFLSITPKTLSKRVLEGKIRAVDGLISGWEIDRYLDNYR